MLLKSVKVVGVPKQTVSKVKLVMGPLPVILTIALAVAVQPVALVNVTRYVPLVSTIIVGVVAPVDH